MTRLVRFLSIGLIAAAVLVLAREPQMSQASGPAVVAYTAAIASDAPRGYWRLGEAQGSVTAIDSSGNGFSGTYGPKVVIGDANGALLYDRDLAASFEGAPGYLVGDDFVSMGDPAGLDFGTGDFSVEAWISTEATNDQPVVTKSSGSDVEPRWEIVVTDDAGKEGRIRVYIYDGAPIPLDVTAYGPTVRVDDGEFHHVVVVFDRDQDLSIFVDGVGTRKAIPMTGSVSNSAPLRVGGLSGVPAFNGEIDDVAIYPTALSATRVRSHYDAGTDPPVSFADETLSDVPTGYWRLGESSTALPAADASGNQLDGAYGLGPMVGRPGALVGDSNTGVSFSGSGGVTVGDLAALDFGTGDFSATAWVKTSANSERVILGKKTPTPGGAGWVMTVTDDPGFIGRVKAEISDGLTVLPAYGPSIRIDDGLWHHVGIAVSRPVGVSVYVDGVENATSAQVAGDVSNTASFRIGQGDGYPSFIGDLDEVAVFANQALHPTAFVTYYVAGAAPSERILELEDPTLVEEAPATSVDDTPTVLPGYDPTLVESPRPGNPTTYPSAKAAHWNAYLGAGSPSETDPTTPGDSTGVAIGPHATGLEGVDHTPSDTTAAVGRRRVVQMVNRRIAVYRKSDLSLVAGPRAFSDFVRPCVSGPQSLPDPQIMWDVETQRWYYTTLQSSETDQTQNCVSYGWSKGSSPDDLANGWCHFHTTVTALNDDYEKLGDNRVFLVIGSNRFTSAHQMANYSYSRLQVIRKPTRRARRACRWPSTVWTSRAYVPTNGDYPATPIPANGVNAQAEAYAVGIEQDENALWLWRVREATPQNPCAGHSDGRPCFADFKISLDPWVRFEFPNNVPQPPPREAWFLHTQFGQLTQAVSLWDPLANRLAVWTQHTVGISPTWRARLRWYEILPSQHAFRQRGSVAYSRLFVFNGGVSPAANGVEAMVHYDTGDESHFVAVKARARRALTPLNTFGPEQLVWSSSYAYFDDRCGTRIPDTCRWGDYAGAAPDPRRPRRIWATNQASLDFNPFFRPKPWTTRNFAGRATP